jgi:hypothetical protein
MEERLFRSDRRRCTDRRGHQGGLPANARVVTDGFGCEPSLRLSASRCVRDLIETPGETSRVLAWQFEPQTGVGSRDGDDV